VPIEGTRQESPSEGGCIVAVSALL
jgi:hypothetical protein